MQTVQVLADGWITFRRSVRLRPHTCRECDREVSVWYDVCPNCGAGTPVKVPRLAVYAITGLVLNSFLHLFC